MNTFAEYKYRFKRYFSFSKEEMTSILILAIVFGFALSFRDWGVTEFNIEVGLYNLLNATLITLLSLIAHESAHKAYAIWRGYTATLKQWRAGVLVTLFITFLTNGLFSFLAYGGVVIHHKKHERLGRFRYYTNLWEHAHISAMGPFANIMLALLFKLLTPLSPIIFEPAMKINILLCLINMIPLPPFDGGDIFYASRLRYVFFLGFFGAMAILLFYSTLGLHIIWISLICAFLGLFVFGGIFEGMFGK